MQNKQPNTVYLADYRQPDYWIDKTELTFILNDDDVIVTSVLDIRRNDQVDAKHSLRLDGQELELISVSVDDVELAASQYDVDDESLTLHQLSDAHQLCIKTRIYPQKNTALEGLYQSGGLYCTQCEAEGFRRITYYLDRPDVMSVFTTHIIADAEKYPVLLSNGNLIHDSLSEKDAGKQKQVSWHDPHKKPAYLFALVAGHLIVKDDVFTTMSGRQVALRIFVEPQNVDKTDYALDALKRSMRWDEETYGREYDLDVFMIVAVDDFNMGAMENKGLNIFNSSCVLANPKTATDEAYQRIEAIVAHEYFHNWSGNRVTCRDWFQLSLKEGFTVFRDACFSADMNSATVKRIEDARLMRTMQFAEDGGPMAHPVQPDSFIEISNFYTLTVYEKGAEIVGMQHKILGAEGFRKGSDLYFQRHDGQAVTIHEFVSAMEDANQIDLTLFKRWYRQAGTPVVTVTSTYDAESQTLSLTLTQQCPATPGQEQKEPMWIPVQLGLLNASGEELPIQLEQSECWAHNSQVLHFKEASQTFTFKQVTTEPVLSLFRDFSAPVKVEFEQSREQLLFLWRHDTDGFNRWDAGQRLMLDWIQDARDNHFSLTEQELDTLRTLLCDETLDAAMVSYLLTLPSEAYVAEFTSPVDPQAIHDARQQVYQALATSLEQQWAATYLRLNTAQGYQPVPEQMSARSLKNLCLMYWASASAEGIAQAEQQFTQADNMTDQMAALVALINSGHSSLAQDCLQRFYQQWQQDVLVVNQWLSVQSGSSFTGSVEHVTALLKHPAFDWRNPNKVRSVLGAFANRSLCHFHRQDGAGYRLIADAVIQLNQANPQIAARLLAPLSQWRRLTTQQGDKMREELQRIMQQKHLSKDVYEVVSKSLV